MKNNLQSDRGSVVLLALCFVAVIGIALASYLALSSRAMTLSDRTVKQGLGQQLGELGIEEGLRAMNLNLFSGADATAAQADWSSGGTSVDWTLDTTNKRARAAMTFPTGKFGTGITATVKIRIDNYDADSLDAVWNSTTNYRSGNIIGYSGIWYRSTATQSNKTPNATSGYWAQEQSTATVSNAPNSMVWLSGTNYLAGNMVSRNGTTYRCISPHVASSTNRPPDGASYASYWVSIPYVTFGSDLQYVNDAMVHWTNTTWYRYSGGSWYTTGSGMPPRWYYASGTTYYSGDMVRSGTTWYRYINSTPTSGNALSDTNYWNTATSFTTAIAANWAWSSSSSYNIGDPVYYSGSWYRCRIANSNQTPSSTSVYWSNAPVSLQTWDAYRQYSQNDTVLFNGIWYLSRTNSNYGNNPVISTNNWHSAELAAQQWSATTTYAANAYSSYGGVWYRCLVGNTGYSPNNTSYWTPTWTQSSGAVSGGPVIYAESTVSFTDGSSSVTQYRAALGRSPLFPNALAATTTLDIGSGTTTSVFSYESTTDSGAATEGYAAVLAAGTASASGTTGLLSLSGSSTTIKGYLAAPAASTGYTPRVSYAANASLLPPSGSAVSPAPTAINVDLTRISGSPYIPQFDIQSVPAYTTLSAISGPVTLGTAGGTTPQVLTRAGNLSLDTSGYTLTIVGPVVIDVQGNLRITGDPSAKIVIAETGSLRLHVSGRLRIDSSGGGIENQTLDPKKCIILSTDNDNDQNFSTTQAFHGVIYMPNEDLLIDATTATIYGAVSARAISVTGNLNLRYDTSLRGADLGGVDRPWAVNEWRELTGANNRATMP